MEFTQTGNNLEISAMLRHRNKNLSGWCVSGPGADAD